MMNRRFFHSQDEALAFREGVHRAVESMARKARESDLPKVLVDMLLGPIYSFAIGELLDPVDAFTEGVLCVGGSSHGRQVSEVPGPVIHIPVPSTIPFVVADSLEPSAPHVETYQKTRVRCGGREFTLYVWDSQ